MLLCRWWSLFPGREAGLSWTSAVTLPADPASELADRVFWVAGVSDGEREVLGGQEVWGEQSGDGPGTETPAKPVNPHEPREWGWTGSPHKD